MSLPECIFILFIPVGVDFSPLLGSLIQTTGLVQAYVLAQALNQVSGQVLGQV